MTIILDLDDVLANLRESLYRTLTQVTGIDFHWRHWTQYDLRQHYGAYQDRLEAILTEAKTLEACQPEPGAAATTRALAEMGCTIAIVTARGWHPRGEALTREWLSAHAIHYDHLALVSLGGDKLEALAPFGNIRLAVDDHPHHVSRYQSAGIPTLLMDRPWNAGFAGRRIYGLEAVVEYARDLAKPGIQF